MQKKLEKRSGKRQKVVRWSMEAASVEFGIHHATLAKRLKAQSIGHGEDGLWSTAQICAAVFGDIAGERLRKTREEADQLALKNAQIRSELIPLAEASERVGKWAVAIKEKILASPLPATDKNDILDDLKTVLITQIVAHSLSS